MSEQTDTIEAVALEKLRADLDEATKQHMPAMVVTTDYLRSVLDRIAALQAQLATARIEGVRAGIEASAEAVAFDVQPGEQAWFARDKAQDNIAALDPAAIVKGME